MTISAFAARALSAFVLIGAVNAAGTITQASAGPAHQVRAAQPTISLTGPRPDKGQTVDPCGHYGNCIANLG